jgi:hypothetical protein
MAQRTILLIHGMGTHPLENMTREFKAGLVEAAKGFGIDDFDPDEKMNIEEFNFSETLDKIRLKLADDANAIREMFPAGHPSSSLVTKLLEYQGGFSEDKMLYTHWLDVALYCLYFGNDLHAQLASKLNNLFSTHGDGEVHVVAHSLGTALLHDTLDKFYQNPDAGDAGNKYPHLRAGEHNLKTLWTVANVSNLVKVLNDYTEGAESKVRVGEDGCTDVHYNVYHQLDPFCWFYPYNKDTAIDPDSEHIENKVVRKKNTHSFQEYVASPDVAKRMLYLFADIDAGLPDDDENSPAYDNYVVSHKEGYPQEVADRIEANISDLRSGSANNINSIKELLKNLKTFKASVEAVWDED